VAEAKKILRLTDVDAPSVGVPAPPPGEAVVPAGDLSRVVEQLHERLANLEKRRAAAKKKASVEPLAASHVTSSGGAAELDARLREFRELEESLQIEKLALHTRLRAAEQEELLLRNESQTLQLKMRSFRLQTQKLRAEEAEVSLRAQELRRATELAAKDRQQIEHARHELEQMRQQMDQQQRAVHLDRATAGANPGAESQAILIAPASPATRSALAGALVILALAATAGVAIALAWLTVPTVYRASATLASTTGPIPGAADVLFNDAILDASLGLLRQRGLQPFDSPAAFAGYLKEHLTLISDAGNHLTLTCDDPLREQAVFILEALTRSYVAAHARESVTVTHAAAADLYPVRDDRPRTATMIFGIGSAALALLTLGTRRLTAKSSCPSGTAASPDTSAAPPDSAPLPPRLPSRRRRP
jgi:hypothetical protein